MPTIPNGALLVLSQHFAEVLQSSPGTSIQVEGKVGGQEDHFICSPQQDGTFDIGDRYCGRTLNVKVKPTGDALRFQSAGGDIGIDMEGRVHDRGFDLVGSMDSRHVEYHCVVHSGVNEHGSIGDVPFNYNRWAQQHGVQLRGGLGDKPILQLITYNGSRYSQTWSGTCGDVTVAEKVTQSTGKLLTPSA